MALLTKFLTKKIFKNSFLFGKILKPRKGPPPKIKKWIKNNSHNVIQDILVCRKPIRGAIKKVLNIITLGKFDKSLKGLRYEDIFHLYLYIKVNNNWYRIEKNEVVSIIKTSKKPSEVCIDLKNKRIRLGTFIKNGENFQKDFWSYSAKNNNCQNFCLSLLLGNKIIRYRDETYKFIKQDSLTIFENNPAYLDKFAVTLTDVAGIFNKLTHPF